MPKIQGSEAIALTAACRLEAAQADKKPRVNILAYGGGVMSVGGWGPIVIDLAGLDCAGQVRLLADHDASIGGLVGHGEAEKKDGKLYIAGVLVDATEAGKQLLALARDGVEFEASVGVSPTRRENVGAGASVKVNGKTIKADGAGFTLIRTGKLREVSILPFGADQDTSVSIAAKKRGREMPEPEAEDVLTGVREQEAAETRRIAAIRDVCKGKHADIEAKAIEESWTADKAELAVIRAERPKWPGFMQAPAFATRDVLASAVMMRAGMSGVAEKAYGEQVAHGANNLRCNSFYDICAHALRMEGRDCYGTPNEVIRAAFSTVSLPTALGDAANKVVQASYNEAAATWRAFAAVKPANDFKEHKAIRPAWLGGMEVVGGGGELKHGSIGEDAVTPFSVDSYGKIMRVTRKAVIDDDLSILNDTGVALGKQASRAVSDLVWRIILANGGSFFSEANANDIGAKALSLGNLAEAVQAMRTQRDSEHNDIDIVPRVLAVSPELEVTARQLIESIQIQYASDDSGPTGNALKGIATPIVESRISNTAKFAGASATAWYLFAGPTDAPVIVAFLKGQQNPTVEYFGLDSNIDTLGMAWRVYLDFGAALNDPKAAVKSAGA